MLNSFRTLAALALFTTTAFAHAAGITLPAYETVKLDNGATVFLMRKTDVPLVAVRVAIRGGTLADAPGKEGTASLLAELLGKGAGKRDARSFAEAVDGAGGELTFSASREALVASASFLAEDADLMLDLLSDALLRPTLASAEFEKSRIRAVQSLTAEKRGDLPSLLDTYGQARVFRAPPYGRPSGGDEILATLPLVDLRAYYRVETSNNRALMDGDPRSLLYTYSQAWLFRDHPYGRPLGGDETSLAALSLNDLRAYYRDQTGADRAVIAVVGDFDPAVVRHAITQHFGQWKAAAGMLPEVAPKPRENSRRVLLVDRPEPTRDISYSYFWIGNAGAATITPVREAQDLVQAVLGAGLTTEMRAYFGPSFDARARIERLRQPGSAYISSFAPTNATVQAIDMALDTLDHLHAGDIDVTMEASAKCYVLGQFALDYETADQLAAALAQLYVSGQERDAIDGYGDRINAVTAKQITAARAVFAPRDDSVMVIIGDAAKIGDAIGKYGPVTRIALSGSGFTPRAAAASP